MYVQQPTSFRAMCVVARIVARIIQVRVAGLSCNRKPTSSRPLNRHISTLKRQRFVETRIVEPDSPNIESCCVVRGAPRAKRVLPVAQNT